MKNPGLLAIGIVALGLRAAFAHDMAPQEQVSPETAWRKASVPAWTVAGAYRVWSDVGPIDLTAIARMWETLRGAGAVALGIPEANALPPPAAIYFTTRATFDAWCEANPTPCPSVPAGWVLLGVYWPGSRTIWTWQNPSARAPAGMLGGRQTLGHELTHHLLNRVDMDHVGGLQDRAGLWLNLILP